MERKLREFCRGENGQGLSEYALLVAAVVVMVVGASALFAGQVGVVFDNVGTYIGGNAATST